jgi:hypothetical protein
MIKWSITEEEIRDILSAPEFDPEGQMYKYLLRWGNRAVRKIHQEVDMRYKLQTANITFTTSDKSFTLPDNFYKVSERFTRVRIDGTQDDSYIPIIGLDRLYEQDPDHDQTTTGIPDAVAIDGGRIYPVPLFAGTLNLENYIREPIDMENIGDYPDLPTYVDEEESQELLIAFVCQKAFAWLQDFDMLTFYRGEWNEILTLYKTHIEKSDSEYLYEAKYY